MISLGVSSCIIHQLLGLGRIFFALYTISYSLSIPKPHHNHTNFGRVMAGIATYNSLFSSALLIILSVISPSAFALVEADNFGFSIELIHRDSPNSPFFNASETPSLLTNALRRSANRVNHFKQTVISPNTAQSVVSAGEGDYLMKISIGTPAIEMLAAADTGSDLVWTQCQPCTHCFKQNTPLFDPKASLTYRNVTCNSTQCKSLTEGFCESQACHYFCSFGDESSTEGVLAMDTVTLGSTHGKPFSLPDTVIGCGTSNYGNFDGTGIVGLGQGPVSLISRMNHFIDGKFSYCLVPYNSELPSKMNFGSTSVVSGPGVASTPIISGDIDTFYYLTLEGISVEGKRLEYGKNFWSSSKKGNIIIDSGTTLTYLKEEMYNVLDAQVREFVHLKPLDDPVPGFSLCYNSRNHLKIPIITMHFTGADLKLNALNTFINITEEDVACLAFAPTIGISAYDISVYGNTQQINFLVGYDLKGKTISFKQIDCTKY